MKVDAEGQFEFNVGDYLKIFPRRKWYVIFPVMILWSMVIFAGFITPKKYSAKAIFMIQEEAMENPSIKGLIPPSSVANRLGIIKQVIFSPKVINRVIETMQQDSVVAREFSAEELIELIKNNVTLTTITKSRSIRNKDMVIEIKCIGGHPVAVARAVDAVVQVFIDESLYAQQYTARSAIGFMEKQVEVYKASLDTADKKLSRFKEKNMFALPQAMALNVKKVVELDAALTETEIRQAEIEKQQEHLADMLTINNKTLVDKRSELVDLMAKYTDKHPKIIALKREVKFLEERFKKERERLLEGGSLNYSLIIGKPVSNANVNNFFNALNPYTAPVQGDEPNDRLFNNLTTMNSTRKMNPQQFEQLQTYDPYAALVFNDLAQFKELGIEKSILKIRQEEILKKMGRYTAQLESIPEKEQTLLILKRNYEVLQRIYEDLYKKMENARFSQKMALTNEVARYRILQQAEVPEGPMASNKIMVIVGGIFGGVFLGIGLAIFKEFTDSSIMTEKDVYRYLGMNTLVTIPNLEEER